jgi:hypothetical protein
MSAYWMLVKAAQPVSSRACSMVSPAQSDEAWTTADRVDGPHRLQGKPVLDQYAAAGGPFSGDRHYQWDGQAEGVRTCNDQDGDGTDDRLVGQPQQHPHHHGDYAGAERVPEQQGRGAVGNSLRPRRGVLRLEDQALDTGQRSIFPDGGDRHTYIEMVISVGLTMTC